MAPDSDTSNRFHWTSFYSGFADSLLAFRHDRQALLAAIDRLPSELPMKVEDRFDDGTSGRLLDICPFTTMGTFNRQVTWDNRRKIARELAGILGMGELEGQIPRSLAGIPVLNNMNSWFFPYEKDRDDDHIDALWQVFADAMQYADDSDETNRASFIDSFNDAVNRRQVSRQLTFGLFWIRPQSFVSLDRHARTFIKGRLGLDVPKGNPDAETYLTLCDELLLMFNDESMPVHSFPELSAMAWDAADENEGDTAPEDGEGATSPVFESPYSVENIVEEGCFLDVLSIEVVSSGR